MTPCRLTYKYRHMYMSGVIFSGSAVRNSDSLLWPFILFPSRIFSLKANHLQTYEGSLVTYVTSKNKINLKKWTVLFRVTTQRVPTFRGNLSVPSSRVKNFPETSVRNYNYTLRNTPEERSSHLLRGGSLKSRKSDKGEMQYGTQMYTWIM